MKKLFVSMVVLAALIGGCGKKEAPKPAPAPAAGTETTPPADTTTTPPAGEAPKTNP
jgi:hypothetical protein